MGRDERKQRKSSPSPPDGISRSGETTRKTHRREEESRDERKKRRRGSEESGRSSRDEKKRKKEKKSKEKERLRDIGSRNLDSFKEISKDDYFSKNNEFSTWLKEEKGTFFSELTSEAARELFLSFVKLWNKQKLDSRYYEGIARAPRTGHHWKIRN
ncbi:splicing regulatory glutamine/lysine-rich-like protein isoform X1 [Wolffia australiana]